jgi:hypothetical protein
MYTMRNMSNIVRCCAYDSCTVLQETRGSAQRFVNETFSDSVFLGKVNACTLGSPRGYTSIGEFNAVG